MVMRNRHDYSGGGDDLPPRVRERMRSHFAADLFDDRRPAVAVAPRAPTVGPNWFAEAARFGLVFLGIAAANVLFLLLALCYLHPLGR